MSSAVILSSTGNKSSSKVCSLRSVTGHRFSPNLRLEFVQIVRMICPIHFPLCGANTIALFSSPPHPISWLQLEGSPVTLAIEEPSVTGCSRLPSVASNAAYQASSWARIPPSSFISSDTNLLARARAKKERKSLRSSVIIRQRSRFFPTLISLTFCARHMDHCFSCLSIGTSGNLATNTCEETINLCHICYIVINCAVLNDCLNCLLITMMFRIENCLNNYSIKTSASQSKSDSILMELFYWI